MPQQFFTPVSKQQSFSVRESGTSINFAELQRIMLQNVGKTQTKSFITYTKETIQDYITNPLSNISNIRKVSQFLWRSSMPYRKLIEYFAQIPLFTHNIIYTAPYGEIQSTDDFYQEYEEVSRRVYNMHLSDEMPVVLATALRDGVYYGYVYDNEESFFLNALDPDYCKINSKSDGVYNFSFDATYFDSGNNKYFLETEDGAWGDVFLNGYNEYKSKGNEYRWFELPPESTICIISGDDPLMPLPYFLPIFVSLLDLLDYESIIRSKTELENYVLLYSKIPLFNNTERVDDFALNLDTVAAMQTLIDAAVPSLVGTAYGPCELDIKSFKQNDTSDTDIVSQSLSNLFSKVGVSEMLFNSDKGGSVGLTHSIKVDEAQSLKFVQRINRWVQRYVTLNIGENFLIKMHEITRFNKSDYIKDLKDLATLGIPVKMDLATATGYSPYEIMNMTYMEKAMMLQELWIPLQSSFNTTSDSESSEPGAPVVPDEKLTDEGQATRDGGKNAK